MEKLYSYKGAYPYPLPVDMTGYNIKDFVLAPNKPTLEPGEVVEWINNAWVVRGPNTAELDFKWNEIRKTRDALLSASDVYVLRLYEQQLPVPEDLKMYRQALRDITLSQSPFALTWPAYTPK